MRLSTIEKLCCSFDKAELELTIITRDIEDHVIEGILYCNHCRRVYPIVSGIPIMSPDEYREQKLEQPLLERWGKADITHDFRLPEEVQGDMAEESPAASPN